MKRIKLTYCLIILGLYTHPNHVNAANLYQPVTIVNQTPHSIKGTIYYRACKSQAIPEVAGGKSWTAPNRGRLGWCLVTKITASVTKKDQSVFENATQSTNITELTSAGTANSKFIVAPSINGFRVFSEKQFKRTDENSKVKSPGFVFENHTEWPVQISLNHVGCLHHDVVVPMANNRPGMLNFGNEVGAIWYTLNLSITPDGKSQIKDKDCIRPIVAEVLGAVLSVAQAVLTGGSGAAAFAIFKQSGIRAAATHILSTTSVTLTYETAKLALKDLIVNAAEKSVTQFVNPSFTQVHQDFLGVKSGFRPVVLYGQYSGYAWPFRCNEKPRYKITGGPYFEEIKLNNGQSRVMLKDRALTVTKINSCGNKMMAGSKTEKSSDVERQDLLSEAEQITGYVLEIDCAHRNVSGTQSNDIMEVSFYSGSTLVSQVKERFYCSNVANHFLSTGHEKNNTPEITHVVVKNTGSDALFIDAASLVMYQGPKICGDYTNPRDKVVVGNSGNRVYWCDNKSRPDNKMEIAKWGANRGMGWCLEKNKVAPKKWVRKRRDKVIDGCHKGIKFDVVSGNAFSAN